jgi:imidazolonepropionase-like amidohydrolase
LDQEIGSLEPGKVADLILVEGDPVQKITDLRRPQIVFKNGQRVV